jgi:uncharacterized protein (TIGR04255 family)
MPKSELGHIYENAPVVEVVAEVLWQLKPILGSDLYYDPFFDDMAEEFEKAITKNGYSHKEQLIPSEVPKELVSYKPYFRFRKDKNQWPLYQIGPGIFTANITPPYSGWEEFSSIIAEGVKNLYETYPISKKHLKPKTLKLMYLNAFGKKQGYNDQKGFLEEGLKFEASIPEDIYELADEPISLMSEFNFDIKKSNGTSAKIKIGSGTSNGNPALIVENLIHTNVEGKDLDQSNIQQWFEDARSINHDIFESYLTDKTRETLRTKKE